MSALGGIAYLADFAIGANIGISYGTTNALWGILVFAVVIMVTGLPVAYYAARYNIDLDLITRGSGFGYYGSVVTNVIFATFTFIFFALEGSIMAQGLQLGLGIPLWAGYAASTLIIFPLVIYGMKVLSKLQLWTTPLWLILMVLPFAYLLLSHPDSVATSSPTRARTATAHPTSVRCSSPPGSACRSSPRSPSRSTTCGSCRRRRRRTPAQWWSAMLLAGPGWVIFGAIKQVIGLFLAVYLIANVAGGAAFANQPVQQFLEIYQGFMPHWAALALAVCLVVISQVKINVTNAYSGSLAWTNSFTRVTKHYPGRLVFLGVNLLIALVLMEANMFDFLNTILGFYANCGMAWVVAVASDIAINKYLLKISPKRPEFRRGMLYAVNPVGFGSMLIAAGVSIAAFFGALGSGIRPVLAARRHRAGPGPPPVIALATKGRYYLRRGDDGIDLPMDDELGNPSGEHLTCHVCHHEYERPDMVAVLRPRGAHLLAVPQHRQARGARPARRPAARPGLTGACPAPSEAGRNPSSGR